MLFSLLIMPEKSTSRPTSDLGFHEEKNELILSGRTGINDFRLETELFLHLVLINMSYTACDIVAVLFNREVHMVVTNSSDCCLKV